MRETMKNLIKNTITSIGIALTVFCITGMVFDISYDGNFSLDNYQFSKMVIGCLIVGLGFGLPTMIYHKDTLPMPFKIIIHMGTGCIIYTIVAYTVGWIGGTSSILHGIIAAIFQIALAFIIWGGFMLHYRNDVRKMIDLFVLRVCGVILCNIGLKNKGKSNRFIPNLICPVNANSPVFIIHVKYTHTF